MTEDFHRGHERIADWSIFQKEMSVWCGLCGMKLSVKYDTPAFPSILAEARSTLDFHLREHMNMKHKRTGSREDGI